MDKVLLGKRIRAERLHLHLTQEKLAEDVGLTSAYIGQIERGEKSLTLESLVNVANRLGVSIDYLLSDSVEYNSDTTLLLISQLLQGRTVYEKEMAVELLKTLFTNLDRKHEK